MKTPAMPRPEKTENVRAVGRALEILLAFTPQDFELSAADLLKRVDLSRPTLYRLIYSLEELGFLVSVGEPQRFRLGPAVAKLAHAWSASLDLTAVADPFLRQLWTATGETVAMFVPQGGMRLCISELPSTQPLNFKRGVGYTERIARGASGRAILAYMEPTAQELRSYVKEAGIDQKSLEAELAQTRKRGYATSHNELIDGAVAVSVPFFDRKGVVAGSIGVFGPAVRLGAARQQEIGQLLVEASVKLSDALGFGSGSGTRQRA
jgi:DNA-binding IclR family transcriptional regulator